ncbi:MAG: BrnA antitoxin family protein [Acidiferrobacter sp.]
MGPEYDFSRSTKNPYASQLKKQITIRLDEESIAYFKSLSSEVGIPYQSLIKRWPGASVPPLLARSGGSRTSGRRSD